MRSLNLSCRFDLCVYNSDVCAIQNFKTGWKEPEPVAINGQMRVEALLVAINLQRSGITPKRFIVQIVTGPWGIMEAEFSYSELAKMYEDITGTLLTLENQYAALNPSPPACGLCPAILVCPAVKDKVAPIKTVLRASKLTNYTTLDAKKLAQNLDEIKILRGYFDEFETFCKNSLDDTSGRAVNAKEGSVPFSIEGYAMVPGAEKRDWKDLPAAKLKLMRVTGMGMQEMMDIKTHTVASYEKVYAKYYGKKVEDIKDAFKQLMDGLIEYSNNKPSLKRVKE